MTRAVVTVPPETPVLALAALLAERGMAAVPVTDSRNRLLGIVAEADLVGRLAAPGVTGDRATAQDVMTRDLVTAGEAMPAAQAAELIERHGVRRLPVVRDGRLMGTVSRADLLRAALKPTLPPSLRRPPAPDETAADAGIRKALRAAMDRRPWSEAPQVSFDVRHAAVPPDGKWPSAVVQQMRTTMAGDMAEVRLRPSPDLAA